MAIAHCRGLAKGLNSPSPYSRLRAAGSHRPRRAGAKPMICDSTTTPLSAISRQGNKLGPKTLVRNIAETNAEADAEAGKLVSIATLQSYTAPPGDLLLL